MFIMFKNAWREERESEIKIAEGDKLARGKFFHGERIEIRMIFFSKQEIT